VFASGAALDRLRHADCTSKHREPVGTAKTTRLEYENQRRGHLVMNTLVNQRRVRKTQPTLENLDLRIAPATLSAGANLAAQLKVESRQVGRWEVSLATATPGSREQTFLIRHIARTEGRMAVQDARLARIDAAHAMAVADPARVRPGHPIAVIAPVGYGTGQSSAPAPSSQTAMAVADPARVRPGHPIAVIAPVGYGTGQSSAPAPSSSSQTAMAVADPAPVRPGHPIAVIAPVGYGTGQSSAPAPSSSPQTASATASGSTSTTTTTLPANVSPALATIYAAYEADPSDFPADIPVTNGATLVQIQGTSVGISVKDSNPADFNTLVTALQSAGMQITDSSATYGLVVGFLPVAQLPTVAALSDAPSVAPLYQTMLQ
jgi:hypothetical protein